jgi:hypothetical protein
VHASPALLLQRAQQNVPITDHTETSRQTRRGRQPIGRVQHANGALGLHCQLAAWALSVKAEVMNFIVRMCLLLSFIVPLPKEANGADAPGPAATPLQVPASGQPSCDSLAVIQARFLLDEPDRQSELTVTQLELLGRCKVSMFGVELTGRRLGSIVLPGADLTNAELAKSTFGGTGKPADLQGTKLNGANLEGADLQRADLRDADLRHTFLRDTNLKGANLSGARMGWPHSPGQSHEQHLTGAQLSSACWAQDNPPTLPNTMKDYKRPSGAATACAGMP